METTLQVKRKMVQHFEDEISECLIMNVNGKYDKHIKWCQEAIQAWKKLIEEHKES